VGAKAVNAEGSPTIDSRRWSKYSEQAHAAGPVRSAYNSWLNHSTSLGYMLRYQPPPARVLSIGCGSGNFDILLASHGYTVTSLDSDPAVLEAVERSARRFDVALDIRQGDAFDLKEFHDRYDISFSGGLVEHWNGTKTQQLIEEHARCAPRVQIEVPTRHVLLTEQIPDVIADAHLFKPGEFAERFKAAGLEVKKLYTLGGVPTRGREIVESITPPVLFRWFQRRTGYSMGIGCIATRRSR